MSLLHRLRCALFGEPCPWRWDEDADDVLRATRALTERANREADALRDARLNGPGSGLPTWEELLGATNGRGDHEHVG